MAGAPGSHRTLLGLLCEQFGNQSLLVDGQVYAHQPLEPASPHDLLLRLGMLSAQDTPQTVRALVQKASSLGTSALAVRAPAAQDFAVLSRAPVCARCGAWFQELRAVDFHRACPHCAGKGCDTCAHTGLPPQAAAVRWQGLRLNELLALPVDEALSHFTNETLPHSAHRLHSEITRRLDSLQRVGLGYVGLDRPRPLSRAARRSASAWRWR